VWHNTLISEQAVGDPYSGVHWKNNLFLGRDTPGRGIMRWANATGVYSSDYNGYRPNRGVPEQYAWLAPSPGETAYEPAKGAWRFFPTLAELRAATGQEAHGLEVDFDVFERMTPPDPSKRHAVYHAMDLNFRLNPQGKAVDAGARIPTVNEGHAGRAPDLGALEVGAPELRFGPRWLTWAPFYR
jgi:hypothetical protein